MAALSQYNIFEFCVSYTMKTIIVISVCAECLFICAEFSDKRKLDRKSSRDRPPGPAS